MTTSNGEGSGWIIPGTGVLANNMLGEDDLHPLGFHRAAPGERVASMMAPSVVVGPDGAVELAAGSGGSKRIRTALTQVISGVVDHRRPLDEAVHAPRLHWDGEVLQVEPGWDEEALAVLRERWPVNVWSRPDLFFGGVHAVVPGREAVGDPRRGATPRSSDCHPLTSIVHGLVDRARPLPHAVESGGGLPTSSGWSRPGDCSPTSASPICCCSPRRAMAMGSASSSWVRSGRPRARPSTEPTGSAQSSTQRNGPCLLAPSDWARSSRARSPSPLSKNGSGCCASRFAPRAKSSVCSPESPHLPSVVSRASSSGPMSTCSTASRG